MKTKTCIRLLIGFAMIIQSVVYANALSNEVSPQNPQDTASIVQVGEMAPDFRVEMLDGSSFKLSDAKGKIVLLNFWTTWCGPCMQEFNEIPEKIVKRFEGKADFVFIPVSREEARETVQEKMIQLKESGIDFPVALDPDRKVYDLYAKIFIPRNYLIGRDGKVIQATIGYNVTEFTDFVEKIAELLK